MMVGIPTFDHPVILEFWRHGPTNSAQDAACDVERTHNADTKARFQAWLVGQEPRPGGVHLFIHSPTRRTKELVDMLSSADDVHHHKNAAVLCDERLYYPQNSLGLQLMTTDRLLADENIPLARLFADEQACFGYQEFGRHGAQSILGHLCRDFVNSPPTAAHPATTVIIAGHQRLLQAIAWALVEGRASLADELIVLNTALNPFDHLVVTLAAEHRGSTPILRAKVKHVQLPTD